MSKKIDLTGQRFGTLLVVEEAGRSRQGKALWLCLCDCGNASTVRSSDLRSKSQPVRSCGKGACNPAFGRTGEANPMHGKTGDKSPSWSGDAVRYEGAHRRITKGRGKASGYRCTDCAAPAQEWSLDAPYLDDPTEMRNGSLLAYSTDPSRYKPRCSSCHRTLDHALSRSRRAVEAGRITLGDAA